jgi:hypothetical protein
MPPPPERQAKTGVVLDYVWVLPVMEDLGLVDAELCAAVKTGGLPFKLTDEVGEPVLILPGRVTHVRTMESIRQREVPLEELDTDSPAP